MRAGVAAKAAGAPIAATAATVSKSSAVGLLVTGGLLLVAGAVLGIYGLSHRDTSSVPPPAVVGAGASVAPSAASAPTTDLARTADRPIVPPVALPAISAALIRSAPPRTTAQASTEPHADAVTREGAILLEARRVLPSDPARALALVSKCEAEFPDSRLAPERARIAAQARSRLAGGCEIDIVGKNWSWHRTSMGASLEPGWRHSPESCHEQSLCPHSPPRPLCSSAARSRALAPTRSWAT